MENCTPSLVPHTVAATSATRPATSQTTNQIQPSGMPTDCAAAWSSATARSARPVLVRWKNSASPATSTPAISPPQTSSLLTRMPPGKVLLEQEPGVGRETAAADRRRSRRSSARAPSSMKVTPMVDMNRVRPSWLTSGPSTKRSTSQAVIAMMTPANSRPSDDRRPDRKALGDEPVERAHQRQAGQQHHRALREVEHAGGLEDQHEAERHQRIEHAGEQAADQHFEELAECDQLSPARLATSFRPAK